MNRERLIAVAGGLASALLYLSAAIGAVGIVLLGLFNSLPLLFVGLSLGFIPALIGAGTAAAAVGLLIGPALGLRYALTMLVPVLILVGQALRKRPGPEGGAHWYPAGHVLGGLTIFGFLLLGGAALFFAGEEGGLRGVIQRTVEQAVGQLQAGMDDAQRAVLTESTALASLAEFLPGALIGAWIVYFAINGMVAQATLMAAGKNLRPAAPFRDLELPGWMGTAIVVCGVLALLPGMLGFLGKNAVIVMLGPFLLLGLAVIHSAMQSWPRRGLGLVILYLLLLFVLGWITPLIAILGIFEQWVELRRRFAKSGGGLEDE